MNIPGVGEVLAGAAIIKFLKGIKDRLWKPKKSKPLNDHSFRQNVVGKNTNVFIINTGSGQNYLGNIDQIPPDAMKVIKESYQSEKKKETPDIKLIRSEFFNEMVEYQDHYKTEDEFLHTILPHIDYEYKSILKLSSYVKRNFENGNKKKAERVKNDIGIQYGSQGRKLCNLYLKGYIQEMMSAYIKIIFESARDKREIGVRLNNLIRSIIKFSEYTFFIHNNSNIDIIRSKVIYGMQIGQKYIALHGAGSHAISKIEEIMTQIPDDIFEDYGYMPTQKNSESTASIPFFDVMIVPKEDV